MHEVTVPFCHCSTLFSITIDGIGTQTSEKLISRPIRIQSNGRGNFHPVTQLAMSLSGDKGAGSVETMAQEAMSITKGEAMVDADCETGG